MKWNVTISHVGKEVKELLDDTKQFDLVREGERSDMRDFCVYFKGKLPKEPLVEGDEFVIEDTVLYVIALGEKLNDSLLKHGACTIDLSGGIVPTGPGVMMLDGDYKKPDFIRKGSEITVK